MNYKVMIPTVLVLVSQSTSLVAAEYIVGASFTPTLSYDDNVLLNEDSESSFKTQIRPTLSFTRKKETSNLLFSAGMNVERYTDLKDLDREDPFANFSSGWNTERSNYGLSASYSENAQRSIAEDDTGDFSSDATVESINVSPTYRYQFTEKDSVYGSYTYSERTYTDSGVSQNAFGSNLNDNKTHSITGGWQHSITERLTGGLALTYSNYESSGNQQSEYDTYNFAVTSSYLLSEKWSLSGQVGYRTLENEITPILGPTVTDESSGSLFSFSSTYDGEINNVIFTLGRSLNPSGEGVVNEQDTISLNWRRSLNEKLSFSINTSYQETQTADDINTTDREYMQFSPSVAWRLQEDLTLRFGYEYREQKGTNVDAVDSNRVFLTLGYDWDGLRFSR
jgi:hypothetical protein